MLVSKLRGRRGRIKSLLLDQAFLGGVGNLYADEALWEARVHPLRTADSLSTAEIKRLARAIKQVLTLGIERRGTSFSPTETPTVRRVTTSRSSRSTAANRSRARAAGGRSAAFRSARAAAISVANASASRSAEPYL